MEPETPSAGPAFSAYGLLVGPVPNLPDNIRVVIVGNGGSVGKSIVIKLAKSSFSPFDDPSLREFAEEAYETLLPSPERKWTAVYVTTWSIDANDVHQAEVQVLANPEWNAELFSLRPPSPRTVNLSDLLGLLIVHAKPSLLPKFTKHSGIDPAVLEEMLKRFVVDFKQISMKEIWDGFEKWNKKVEKLKSSQLKLIAALGTTQVVDSSTIIPSLKQIRAKLDAKTGDDRLRLVDALFAPLLNDISGENFVKLLDQKHDLDQDAAAWLFRRTFNRTVVYVSRDFVAKYNYPKQTLIRSVVDPTGIVTVIELGFDHSESEFLLLQSLWVVNLTKLKESTAARKTLLSWAHMDGIATNGVNFPWMTTAVHLFSTRDRGQLNLFWDERLKGFVEKNPLIRRNDGDDYN